MDFSSSVYCQCVEVYVMVEWLQVCEFVECLGFEYEGMRCVVGCGGEDL